METKEPKKFDSILARAAIALIVITTAFIIYLTIKLVISGFTFR